jgi:ketosteroid isomerase-like protein
VSAAENKLIVERFFDSLSRGDVQAVVDAYSDDGTCWTAGTLPFSGTKPKPVIAELTKQILATFPEGLHFAITGITAEGDRVAVESESHGRHASGRLYQNQYHFLFRLRAGQIVEMREYLDTMRADEVLVRSGP